MRPSYASLFIRCAHVLVIRGVILQSRRDSEGSMPAAREGAMVTLLDPKNDYVFKRLFAGDPELTVALINDLRPVKRFTELFDHLIAEDHREVGQILQRDKFLRDTDALGPEHLEQLLQVMDPGIFHSDGTEPGFKRLFHGLLSVEAEDLVAEIIIADHGLDGREVLAGHLEQEAGVFKVFHRASCPLSARRR